MYDEIKKFLCQVELNTIASSLGSFSDNLKKFHNHFKNKYPEIFSQFCPGEYSIPEKEDTIEVIADSMKTAIDLLNLTEKDHIIVFVIQENERNVFDQRAVENMLWNK
jgi:hypothetical protein